MKTCIYCTRDAAVYVTMTGDPVCSDCSIPADRNKLVGLQASVDADAALRSRADEDEQHERDELQQRANWQQAQRLWNDTRWATLRATAAARAQHE